jgi:hypothetical protein
MLPETVSSDLFISAALRVCNSIPPGHHNEASNEEKCDEWHKAREMAALGPQALPDSTPADTFHNHDEQKTNSDKFA